MNEKSLIECLGKSKCFETVVRMSGKCFIFMLVHSLTTFFAEFVQHTVYDTFCK